MNQASGSLFCALLLGLALSAAGLLAAPPATTTSNAPAVHPPMPPSPTNPPTAIGWQPLFALEPWYQQQPAQEELFTGILSALTPPALSTRMREPLYQLGDTPLFTRARKVPALDALLGQTIELRGKAVALKLEGQTLREIWPAAVRRLPPTPSPTSTSTSTPTP